MKGREKKGIRRTRRRETNSDVKVTMCYVFIGREKKKTQSVVVVVEYKEIRFELKIERMENDRVITTTEVVVVK